MFFAAGMHDGKTEGGGSHDIVWLRKIWLKRNSRTFDGKSATLSQETKKIFLYNTTQEPLRIE
jgi:hypothetical protein